ncbi:hypothetical protein [Xylanimonas allomyrinae]|uniref:hypothetical protein n=1 Tax=Xylanimonas allomyrinae TaxID=2509459 RepID=UPI001FE488FA|nr:hypothetical protein [Xylanimonas allomyrinae]
MLAHAWIVLDGVSWSGEIFGDVSLYHWWAHQGFMIGRWPVLDYDWVYPAAALLPIAAPAAGTSGFLAYAVMWSAGVIALNGVALWMLARTPPRGRLAAWWWLLFLVALGPIWLGRLDGVAAPLILIALLQAARRPAVAAAVATLGAWIKIAPGAIVVALAATSRNLRTFVRQVAVPGAVVSAVVVGLALAGGAGARAWSVFGEQEARTLQAESVAATAFSVARLWNPAVRIEYNDVIFTYEVHGEAARQVASALDTVLPVAVVLIGLLAWAAARRRPDLSHDVLLLAAAATLLALIVFNKVGSPQFIAWLGPPVAAALALAGPGARHLWSPPALGMLGVGALTQILYPIAYGHFLRGDTWMVAVPAVRNLALVVLLAGAVWRLGQLALSRRPVAP